jgi:hypothetical protein
MTAVNLEVLTNRTAVMKRFAISTAREEKRRMRVMSTPTTVKFQIAVSANDENGQPCEKLFLVDMNVEAESGEVLGFVVSNDNDSVLQSQMSPQPVPSGVGMPPQDPPTIEISVAA